MRPHVRFYSDPAIVTRYLNKPDALPIGGTVPMFSYTDLLKRFAAFRTTAADKCFMHVTMSLPKGLAATGRLWWQVVKTILTKYGLDPDATPWFAARHTDGSCDHIHIISSLRDFVGQRRTIWLDQKKSDHVHQYLCMMLGLPAPAYFDPEAAPRLAPVTPARNLTHKIHKQLFTDLKAVFRHDQPQTTPALSLRLSRQPGGFTVVPATNNKGDASLKYISGRDVIFGGEIGLAWQPRFVKARVAFCQILRRARYGLQLSNLIDIFRKPEMENLLDQTITAARNARAAASRTDPLQAINGNQDQGSGTAPPAGPADDTGRSKGNSGGTVGRIADGPDANITNVPSPAPRNDASDPQLHGGHGSRRENRPSAARRNREEARPHPAGAEHSHRLTLGALLIRARTTAQSNRTGWQAVVNAQRQDVVITFTDQSTVIITADGAIPDTAGEEANAFVAQYRKAWPKFQTLDLSPMDDEHGGPSM